MSKESAGVLLCPYCGRVAVYARVLADEDFGPFPGSYSLCGHCGEIGQFRRKGRKLVLVRCVINWATMPSSLTERVRANQQIVRAEPDGAPSVRCSECGRQTWNVEDLARCLCGACAGETME